MIFTLLATLLLYSTAHADSKCDKAIAEAHQTLVKMNGLKRSSRIHPAEMTKLENTLTGALTKVKAHCPKKAWPKVEHACDQCSLQAVCWKKHRQNCAEAIAAEIIKD